MNDSTQRQPPGLTQALAPAGAPALPLHAVSPAALPALLAGLPPATAQFLHATGFAAKPQECQLLPGPEGLAGAVLGLGLGEAVPGPWSFGALPYLLPAGTAWTLADAVPEVAAQAALGWALGAYRYSRFKAPPRAPAQLALPPGCEAALQQAAAIWRARDLINTPANLLGPAELAAAAQEVAAREGARCEIIAGEELAEGFPALHAVGAGSPRTPRVIVIEWGVADAPLVALCGKGVCFDTGGLDLKPSSAMLRMKKDMGGAALALGLAEMVMQAKLPVRLLLLIGAVENAVSGESFRPLDVLRSRAGLSIEVGNTDAEGRLVLADLLTYAVERSPALVLDFATLTGAARVALGPDLPALFTPDDALAETLLAAGQTTDDPLWRLPLHKGYDSWLDSSVAEMNNVSNRPMAGAIIGALFLKRFVPDAVRWAHVDVYAWNDATRPGRPEGGEAQAIRAALRAISTLFDGVAATHG
ncbi:leucyl aminopeptidase family protein [Siccirubricoccus sp. KC 17139]|uniref:Leucyl aminopeptidase family protein n=1 Tax=Siccirubricoccus soli TaxID=2899147 RepID=A0ABT1DB69_9PROT|nr:leucyl aminopeptidase family protein [Siccirubricoccus soli]MCO6418424.1 leucyl aminopeptidase family protein [Siccirubricoccus soli]MCP2684559.1 leucyl aminopeptidase family protein [Siccirubricoccus soli]